MSVRNLFLLSLVAIGSAANTVLADIVVSGVPAPSRSVLAVGGIPPLGGSDSTTGLGLYSVDRLGGGPSGTATISTHASHASSIPPPVPTLMDGEGLVEAGVTAPTVPPPPGVSGTAESFFDVFFTVDLSGTYAYDAEVTWVGDAPLHAGFSRVRLSNNTTLTLISDIEKNTGDQGSEDVPGGGILVPLLIGNTYRIEAHSRISVGGPAAGLTDSKGTWSFSLSSIPEPNAWVLWLPIATGLATAGICRRIFAAR